ATLTLTNAPRPSPPGPGNRRIRAPDSAGKRQHRKTHERPGKQASERAGGEDDEREHKRADWQLALTDEAVQAAAPDLEIDSADGASPEERDTHGEDEPEQKPVIATLPQRGRHVPRSPDTQSMSRSCAWLAHRSPRPAPPPNRRSARERPPPPCSHRNRSCRAHTGHGLGRRASSVFRTHGQ